MGIGIGPSILTGAQPVFAQATRTWVSGVGDDVNPCSRTAPCKTFAGAISKTAAGGEIDALDPGGFGTVTITKAITIDGTTGAGFGSILASGTNGIIINATGATDVVTLRNLSINGAGTTRGLIGVKILAANRVIIENSEIFGFGGAGNFANGRGISDQRTAAGGVLSVLNTTLSDNDQAGIVVGASGGNRITANLDNLLITGNSFGAVIAFGSLATISDSTISGNLIGGATGVAVQITGTEVQIERTVVSGNANGVAISAGIATSPTVRMSDVSVYENTGAGVSASSGQFQTFGNNHITGNGSGNAFPAGTVAIGNQ